MNMPSKGETVTVDGYGTGTFAGMSNPDDHEGIVMLKFEGTWNGHDLDAGYGSGIVGVPLTEWNENRIYPEQCSGTPDPSTEKRDEVFENRFER